MSTIERALEKQRQLVANRRQLEREQRQTEREACPSAMPDPACATAAPNSPVAAQRNTTQPDVSPPADNTPTASLTPPSSPASKPAQQAGHTTRVNIDIKRLESLGMVSPTENFTKIKEEYRYIKRPLLNNAFGPGASTLDQPSLVMVSSSLPGEGKTFTAINLAISMAMEEDRQVLLIDADLIKPSVCNRLGIAERSGLMDYLTGKVEVSDIILNTNIPNLKLIAAGRRHHHSNEMIASEKMKRFMEELSVRYPDRIVIFDTSPLLGASETNVLAQLTGQAVIVVEEKKTSQAQLQQSLSLLNPNMAIGLVLNKSNGRRDNYGYYYANS
ncbi:MAG: protein-tyrosine kinase [Motiliproteus sp.]|jgi:protein-tyrosine kinase